MLSESYIFLSYLRSMQTAPFPLRLAAHLASFTSHIGDVTQHIESFHLLLGTSGESSVVEPSRAPGVRTLLTLLLIVEETVVFHMAEPESMGSRPKVTQLLSLCLSHPPRASHVHFQHLWTSCIRPSIRKIMGQLPLYL